MDKPVFLAHGMTKILDLAARSEVTGAIDSALSRGIMSTDNGFATAASGWRHENGCLFATHTTVLVPGSHRVELQREQSNGYRTAA